MAVQPHLRQKGKNQGRDNLGLDKRIWIVETALAKHVRGKNTVARKARLGRGKVKQQRRGLVSERRDLCGRWAIPISQKVDIMRVAECSYRSTPHCRGRGRIVLFTVAKLARDKIAPACALASTKEATVGKSSRLRAISLPKAVRMTSVALFAVEGF